VTDQPPTNGRKGGWLGDPKLKAFVTLGIVGLGFFGVIMALLISNSPTSSPSPAMVNQPSTSQNVNNHLPSATDQSITTNTNTSVNIILTGSDPNMNTSLTAAIITAPSHGTLGSINQVTGIVTYTPKSGFSGKDKFTSKVNDGKADSNNVGTVSIAVNPPVVKAGPNQTAEENATVVLKGIASDPDSGDKLSYSWKQMAGMLLN
jgi:hypothetical protein